MSQASHTDTGSSPQTFAVGLAVFSAILWGLWWLPIRALEDAGLGGAWAGLAMAIGTLPALLIAVVITRGESQMTARSIAGAFLVGLAVTLYATSLTFTDVVRAVLIFYLAPAWSTIIECVFLGRKWNWRSALALLLSFGGLLFVMRGEISLNGLNIGDLMALGSGLSWSIGAALIFTAPPVSSTRLALFTGIGAIIAGSSLLFVAGDTAGTLAANINIVETALPAILSGCLYLAPILFLTMWSARRLPPATMSFILTAEILSGVISAALLLDETFGWPEAIGCLLIVLGAAVEVIKPIHLRVRKRRL